jgi:3-oxoacyl-(acyl-carrier-protein) synthase
MTDAGKVRRLGSTIVEQVMSSGVSARISGLLALGNQVTTNSSACSTGTEAILDGAARIRAGLAERMLCGGSEGDSHYIWAGFDAMKVLSRRFNEEPEKASRPMSASAGGFVPGSGAGVLHLESLESAQRRGARIYAELAGDGNSLSSYRITDSPPDGDGPIQAMRQALADAGATVADIDYINAHGTSTGMNDRSETAAIRAVFGDDAARVRVSSTKSTMGHLIAAAGAVEGVVCALAIARGAMPVNANLVVRDPDCDLNIVTGAPQRGRIRMTLSNSFGFGGSNSCIAMRHPHEVDGGAGKEA